MKVCECRGKGSHFHPGKKYKLTQELTLLNQGTAGIKWFAKTVPANCMILPLELIFIIEQEIEPDSPLWMVSLSLLHFYLDFMGFRLLLMILLWYWDWLFFSKRESFDWKKSRKSNWVSCEQLIPLRKWIFVFSLFRKFLLLCTLTPDFLFVRKASLPYVGTGKGSLDLSFSTRKRSLPPAT